MHTRKVSVRDTAETGKAMDTYRVDHLHLIHFVR